MGIGQIVAESNQAVCEHFVLRSVNVPRGEFRPRQTRQLPRAVDLKGRLLSCQSY